MAVPRAGAAALPVLQVHPHGGGRADELPGSAAVPRQHLRRRRELRRDRGEFRLRCGRVAHGRAGGRDHGRLHPAGPRAGAPAGGADPLAVVRPVGRLPAGRHRHGGGRRGVAGHVLPGRGRRPELRARRARPGAERVPQLPRQLARVHRLRRHLAGRPVRHDDLPRRAGGRKPGALRGVRRRRRLAVAADLARHPAGTEAGVRHPAHARGDPGPARLHRGLPADQRRPRRLHRGAADPDVQTRPRTQRAGCRGGRDRAAVRGAAGADRGLAAAPEEVR